LIEKKEITRTRSQYNLFELDVSCSDHGIRLVDKLVTRVFYGQDISETVKQLLQLVPGLSPDTKHIYPSETTLDEIRFAYKTVYECLNALSKLPRVGEFSFYVDANKKLHFEPLGLEHSGLTLRPNDIVNLKFARDARRQKHRIYVRGSFAYSVIASELDTSKAYSLHEYHYAQSFVYNDVKMERLQVFIKKVGDPPDDFTGKIVEDSAGDPMGYEVKSFSLAKAEVPTTADWKKIIIAAPVTTGKTYWLRLNKVGDASNTYIFYGPSTGTNFKSSPDGTTWTAVDGGIAFKLESPVPVISVAETTEIPPDRIKEDIEVTTVVSSAAAAREFAKRILKALEKEELQISMQTYACYPELKLGQKLTIDDISVKGDFVVRSIEFNFDRTLGRFTYSLKLTGSRPPETIEEILRKTDERMWEERIKALGLDEKISLDVPLLVKPQQVALSVEGDLAKFVEGEEQPFIWPLYSVTWQASGTFTVGTAKVGYSDVA